MKSALRATLLLLAVLALPASVSAYGCPLFPCAGQHCAIQLGPWYLYYPYNAYFQTPAPIGYPNFQGGAMPAAPVSYVPPAPAWTPPAPQPLVQPTGYVQPVSYPQPPNYWYGNR